MALSADRETREKIGIDTPVPVAASTKLYGGGLVAVDADGYAVPGADTAGLKICGVAQEQVDNSSGADGDLTVKVRRGRAFLLKGSGLTQAMLGDTLYAVDDETVAAASVTTNDIPAGKMVEFVSATAAWVLID
jgi:hypothetical protein